MQHTATNTADLETIQKRLEARAEQIDRPLDHALRQLGLTRAAFDTLSERVKVRDPRKLEVARKQLTSQLTDDGTSWEQLTKPEVNDLAAGFRGRLIRA